MKLAERTRTAALDHSTLKRGLSLRHICEAIQFAQDERGLTQELLAIAKGILVSLDHKNQVNQEQLKAFEAMLEEALRS